MGDGWHKRRIYSFDTETDSPNPLDAHIISATLVRVSGGERTLTQEWLLRPRRPIPAEATEVHGITNEHAQAHGRDSEDCLAEIVDALAAAWAANVPVVAFNASFDFTVLDRELVRHRMTPLADRCNPSPIIDPLVIDRAVDKYRKGKRTLTACCETYGVLLDGAHNATADALAAARVAWAICEQHPDIAATSPHELHEQQIVWSSDWARGFTDYLRKQGKPEQVDGTWPIRAAGGEAA